MTRKSAPKPKPESDRSPKAEYERFLEAAAKAEASDDPKDLDRALKKITQTLPRSE